TITVDVLGNQTAQSNRSFTVSLANPTNAAISRGTATGTIIDNDGLPSLAIDDASLVEPDTGTQPMAFTLRLSQASGLPVTVQYATQDGTARSPADYTAVGGSVTFAPGETTRQLVVQVQGDALAEPNEQFSVRLA